MWPNVIKAMLLYWSQKENIITILHVMPHFTIFHADNGSITLRKVTSKNICHQKKKKKDHRNLYLIPCKIQPTICQKPHR